MTNQVHLIFSVTEPNKPELVLGDFKRFTIKLDRGNKHKPEGKQEKNDYDKGIDIFKPKSNTSKFRVQLGKSVPYNVKQTLVITPSFASVSILFQRSYSGIISLVL
jgi:hypothetical protein